MVTGSVKRSVDYAADSSDLQISKMLNSFVFDALIIILKGNMLYEQ
jgi:hypothetical protein